MIVSSITYYLLYGITAVIRELGILMDRGSSNFRSVNFKLRERSKTLYNGGQNPPVESDNRLVTTSADNADIAIEITDDENGTPENPMASSEVEESVSKKVNKRTVSVVDIMQSEEKPLLTPFEYVSLLLRKFWLSFYYFLVAQTDYFCYFMITLSLLLNGSIADAILALITLSWGLLSRPRPSKTFWSFCITYVVGLILLKYCLKFRVFDYNLEENNENHKPIPDGLRLWFGISAGDSLFVTQLLLLISLCFHRNVLVSFGLWIAPERPENSETPDNSEADSTDPGEKKA